MQTRLTGIDQIKSILGSRRNSSQRSIRQIQTLLSNEFMQRNTRFWSVDEMQKEFKKVYGVELTTTMLGTEIFNKFIEENSKFKKWRELLNRANEINMNRLVRRAISI